MLVLRLIWTVNAALTAIDRCTVAYSNLLKAGVVQGLMGCMWKSGFDFRGQQKIKTVWP